MARPESDEEHAFTFDGNVPGHPMAPTRPPPARRSGGGDEGMAPVRITRSDYPGMFADMAREQGEHRIYGKWPVHMHTPVLSSMRQVDDCFEVLFRDVVALKIEVDAMKRELAEVKAGIGAGMETGTGTDAGTGTGMGIGARGRDAITPDEGSATSHKKTPRSRRKPVGAHHAVCDVCDHWIEGIRYACAVCVNFDLCQDCEAKDGHEHALIKILNPQQKFYAPHRYDCEDPTRIMYRGNWIRPGPPYDRRIPSDWISGHAAAGPSPPSSPLHPATGTAVPAPAAAVMPQGYENMPGYQGGAMNPYLLPERHAASAAAAAVEK